MYIYSWMSWIHPDRCIDSKEKIHGSWVVPHPSTKRAQHILNIPSLKRSAALCLVWSYAKVHDREKGKRCLLTAWHLYLYIYALYYYLSHMQLAQLQGAKFEFLLSLEYKEECMSIFNKTKFLSILMKEGREKSLIWRRKNGNPEFDEILITKYEFGWVREFSSWNPKFENFVF